VRELAETPRSVELKTVPLDEPKPAVTDEARKRLALEDRSGEDEAEPEDAPFETDGVDIDLDDNSYSNVKIKSDNGNRGGNTSGGGASGGGSASGGGTPPSAKMATTDNIGLVTWVRRLFGRS
jgi:uncharacterized membrane protein YgcG